MPNFDFICEVCEKHARAWRQKDSPPRFCSKECRNEGLSGTSLKPEKWLITPEIHEAIKKIYQTDTGNGQVAALAKNLGYPRWKISRYAIQQAWTPKQKREPDWTDKELEILKRSARHSPETIQRRLKQIGFYRTTTGIVLKRKRMRFLQNLNGQSAYSLGMCFGVDRNFITRAIRQGLLKAKKRGTKRTERQGGDAWYIKDKDVREYVINHVNEIDFRKIDKYWLVDLLAEK